MSDNSQLNRLINKSDIAALPVLHNTLQLLKAALEKPSFNYRFLDSIIQYDPACTINLLAYANQEINQDSDKEISQVEHAAMFLGMERLEKFIGKITSIYSIKEKKISDKIIKLQHRGVHAAFQAQSFARMVDDSSVNEIYTSTLVSPISELLCWKLEPIKAQKVELLIHQKKSDSVQAQKEVFGFSYHELAEALTQHWKIPNLFLQRQEMETLEDATKTVKCMYLAEKCSIIAEKGWYFNDMYEYISLCSDTLHFSEARIAQELHKSAITMAHNVSEFFPEQSVPGYLALLPGEVPYSQVIEIPATGTGRTSAISEIASPDKAVNQVKAQQKQTKKTFPGPEQITVASINLLDTASAFPDLIRLTMNALYETDIFNRVAFMMLSKDKKSLTVRSIRGNSNKDFTKVSLPMQPANLFTKLLAKPQSVFINQQNYPKFAPIINQPMQDMLKVREFIAKSVHVQNKPIGLFYMDKFPLKELDSIEPMEVNDFNEMKKICMLFDEQLKNIR